MMRWSFLLSIIFLSSVAFAAGDWFSQTFREDSQNHYYVGVSEGETNLNEALEEAYQNAIDEALRHNFGFKKQGQKSYLNTLYKSSLDERSFIKTQTVTLKDVKPGLQKVKKTSNGSYLVYRQVIYSKVAIEKEKRRLALMRNGEKEVINEYGLQGKTLGQVLIKTIPSNAQILLTRVDGKGTVSGTGDARFRVPLGEYHLTLIKDGHRPHSEKILVTGKESLVEVRLKESLGYLKLDIEPKDVRIYIDNQRANNEETIPLKVGRDYTVRVEHGDYKTHVESVSPWIDQTVTMDMALKPKKARLSVLTQPAGARITIDGVVMGNAPLKEIHHYPSEVDVLVEMDGFQSSNKRITLRPNQDHPPLVFTLKKISPRRPTSVEKKEITTTEEANISLGFLGNNYSRHNWIYNPVVGDNENTTFVLLPVQYQYFMFRHLAIGFDYRYHLETDDTEFSVDERAEEYEKETVSQVWSVNSTLYLIRNRRFSVGFGPEYTWRKKQVRYLRPGTESRVASFSGQEEALGYKGMMQIGLSERDNGHVFGLNIDYRKYDLKNSNLGSWSVGFYWEF